MLTLGKALFICFRCMGFQEEGGAMLGNLNSLGDSVEPWGIPITCVCVYVVWMAARELAVRCACEVVNVVICLVTRE